MFGGGGSSTTFTNPSVFRREELRGVMFGGGGSSTLHLRILAGGAGGVIFGGGGSRTLHLRILAGGARRSNVWRWRVQYPPPPFLVGRSREE